MPSVAEGAHPVEGTPEAEVSESNVVNTNSPVWCVGATAGSRMMSTMVPIMCQTVDTAFQMARKRVGRKLISACSTRMTAQAHVKAELAVAHRHLSLQLR